MQLNFQIETQHSEQQNGLPDNQKAAIRRYINSSTQLNKYLREGFDVTKKEHCDAFQYLDLGKFVTNLDKAIANAPKAINTFYVYRGINSQSIETHLNAYRAF